MGEEVSRERELGAERERGETGKKLEEAEESETNESPGKRRRET